MRQIVQMEVEGTTLMGTYHRPLQDDPAASTEHLDKGLLILNTGAAPRSGDGDLDVQLADRMMNLGYHVFRFDMPGLGEAPGNLPEQVLTYHLFVKRGGNAPYTSQLIAALKQKYHLSGLVLLGNCGGSVTASMVAATMPEDVLGVILLDPVFHLREERQERIAMASNKGPAVRNPKNMLGAGTSLRKCLKYIPGMGFAKTLYRAIAKRRLPRDTSLPLVQIWMQLVDMDMPMLVFLAHAIQDDAHLRVLLRKPSPRTNCVEVPNTNHLFSTDNGKTAVFSHVKQWLLENVPPQRQTAAAATARGLPCFKTLPA